MISEDHVTLKTSNDAENTAFKLHLTYIQIENCYFNFNNISQCYCFTEFLI